MNVGGEISISDREGREKLRDISGRESRVDDSLMTALSCFRSSL